MDTLGFLSTVWPSTGPYCIARPLTDAEVARMPADRRPNGAHRPFRQYLMLNQLDAAMLSLQLDTEGHDVYFAVGSLIKPTVRNEKGNLVVSRKADNIRDLRTFFLDLDVGTEDNKYPSQYDALVALQGFCRKLGFPKPLLVSSGGGIHAYWTVDDPVPRDEWKLRAEQLKSITIAHGLKNDTSIVADVARVLRVVGTHNHKRAEPRPVEVLA